MNLNSQNRQNREAHDKIVHFLENLLNLLIKNKIVVFSVVALFFIVGLTFIGVDSYTYKNEENAQVSFYKAEKLYRELIQSKKKDNAKEDSKNSKAIAANDEIQKVDEPIDYTSAINAFKKIREEYKNSKASILASISLTEIFEKTGQLNDAVDTLKSNSLKESHLLYGIVQLRLGHLLSELNKCNEAISHLQNVLNVKELSYLHSYALLNQALCNEKLGKNDIAISQLEKLNTEYQNSSAARSGKNYLKLIKNSKGN